MIAIRRAEPADAAAAAEVFLGSYAATYEGPRAHTDDEVRAWVRNHLVVQMETWVAIDGSMVVGILTLSPGWVDQLYVAPDRLGQGIGRALLDVPKGRSDGPLELWTFQVNARARRFYERNEFVLVEMTDGSGNLERQPDVRYRWEPTA